MTGDAAGEPARSFTSMSVLNGCGGEDVTTDGFEAWALVSAPRLKGVARLLTGSDADAEDLLQDTLVRLLTKGPRVDRMDSPDAYARRIMTNLFLDQARRRQRFRRLMHLLPGNPTSPSADELHETSKVSDLLRSLGARQRAVLVLRYQADLSDAEIADVLGCSASTVRSQAARALQSLRHEHATPMNDGRSHRAT